MGSMCPYDTQIGVFAHPKWRDHWFCSRRTPQRLWSLRRRIASLAPMSTLIPTMLTAWLAFFPPTDAVGQCEPIEERWSIAGADEQALTQALVNETCRELGADCALIRAWALRESTWTPWRRHRMAGDRLEASSAYIASAKRYGYSVRGVDRHPETREIRAIRVRELPERDANPYYPSHERWMHGLGLLGQIPGWHLAKWDPMAEPEVLCDPVVATIVAIRIARQAQSHYGATSYIAINAVYAGRTQKVQLGDKTVARAKLDESKDRLFAARAKSVGLDPFGRPQLGTALGSGPVEEQEEVRARIHATVRARFEQNP